MRGRISPDGSRVVFESADGEARSVHLVAAEGGTAEKLCDDGGLMDFASDGRRVVCALMPARGFDSIDVVTRQRIEILRHPKYPLHRAAFSPDNQWLTMNVPAEPGKYSPVIVTRLRDGKASSNEKDWIVISNQGGTDRHPWWSPDGNLLYFISARDGFDCFYARRLDPATKQGLGPVFSVYHFHGARRSIRPQAGYLGPSLLKDQLIFSMTEITGNVWMTKLP
jgi:tricorn protease-like protein